MTDKIGSGATPRGGQSAYKESGVSLIRSLNVYDLDFRYKDLARIDDEQAAALSNVEVEARDVLLNITGASIARCSQVPSDVLPARVNQHVSILRPKNGLLDSRFLSYLLVSDGTKNQLLNIGDKAGATRQALTKAQLQTFEIPVPPLDEQKRIVAVLDQAFAALDRAHAHAEANLADAEQLVAGVTEQLFPNDDAMTSGRSLADLCEAIIDCEHKTAPTQDQGIPSIRTPNIGRGVLLLSGVNRVSEETYREWTRRAEPQPGDLILAREAPAGNVAVIPEGMLVCLGQRTVLLRPKKDLFVPAYLAHLLLRSSSQARLLAHSRGATVQHINVKDIRAFKVSSLPSLDEQGAVVRGIERLIAQGQALVSVYAGKLADIANLRQSLLQKAFSGQLT